VGTDTETRFASLHRRDSESNLDPTHFRMFSSDEGRWLSPDPLAGNILNPQSLNRYAYVMNNPTSFTDPLGLCRGDPGGGPPCGYPDAPPSNNPFGDAGCTPLTLVSMVFTPTAEGVGYFINAEGGIDWDHLGEVIDFAIYGNWDLATFMPSVIWSPWYSVVATLEGRGRTTSGELHLNPKTSYGFNPLTADFVALPDSRLIGNCVEVVNPQNSASTVVPVGYLGPYNGGGTAASDYTSFNDPYWSPGRTQGGGFHSPETSTGISLRGRTVGRFAVGAGVDISYSLAQRLGLKGNTKVDWRFTTCPQ